MVENPHIDPPPQRPARCGQVRGAGRRSCYGVGPVRIAADALEQALAVKSVRDLADTKYVRRAQAIVNLANQQELQ